MAGEHQIAAAQVIRRLTGSRWVWPPVRVREIYPLRRRIVLVGRPILAVQEVTDVTTGEAVAYTRRGQALLFDRPVCAEGHELEVVYDYGSKPPALLWRGIEALASEMALSDQNDGECRLPERVTSITRQGVSWTLIDPMTFLDKGRTGIYEVDLAIAAFGPRTYTRTRVFSPGFPPPDRIEVIQLTEDGSVASP